MVRNRISPNQYPILDFFHLTSLWWTLNLLYDGESNKQVFPGNTFDEKIAYYDTIEEKEDEFLLKVFRISIFLITPWLTNQVSTKEDFDKLMELFDEK